MTHRKRAGESNTEWYSRVADLPQDWDEGLPGNHFLRKESLKIHEFTLPDVGGRYALLRSKDGIIARAAFQLLSFLPEHVSKSSLPAWQYNAWKLYTNVAHPKLLVGGQLFRHDAATVHFSDLLTPYNSFAWYRDTLRAAMRDCGVQAVLVKEPPASIVPLFVHNAPDYLLLRNDGSMQMTIPEVWRGISDYEKSLKHKYAQRFRKVRQAWANLEIHELSADNVRDAAADMYALYRQVTERQTVRMGLLSESFIPELKKFYGDRLKVWGIYERGAMIAFASAWVQEQSFDMFYIGFDYSRNTELQLYFNILFFSIEQAILLRKSLLILGRTALEAKARVGCRPVYLNTFLFIRNPLLRGMMARMQGQLGESGSEWEQRHPFKPALGDVATMPEKRA